MGTILSLQIAVLAAILILGGLSWLKFASIRLDKRYPREPRD